jgi:hypothetical protein
MLDRCYRSNHPFFHRYGGKDELGGVSVTVCARWRWGEDGKSAFMCFLEDMGERPEGKTLDRKKSTDDYSKETCKWSTPLEQAHNKENSKALLIDGVPMTLPQAVDHLGRPSRYMSTYLRRLAHGWDPKDAIMRNVGAETRAAKCAAHT